MTARSKARKQALDLLYEADIRGTSASDLLLLRDFPDEGPDLRPIREFTKDLDSLIVFLGSTQKEYISWLTQQKLLITTKT